MKQIDNILNQIHDAVIITDLSSTITSWNKGAEFQLEYTSEEAIGQPIYFLYPETKEKLSQGDLIELLKETGALTFEAPMRKKSGKEILVHTSLSPIIDSENNITGVVSYTLDITEQRKAEEARLEKERIEAEKRKLDELLNIILPVAAANELMDKGFVVPLRYEDVAVLFCDVIHFTKFSNSLTPEEVVGHVTELFECLEVITEQHGMEKIKTIGDEFMATAGLLEPNKNPLESAINCGLAMSEATPKLGAKWHVRVGVAIGPVVAGIIGSQKFQFDLWGDAVNLAARMTRFGRHGVVTMTEDTWLKVSNRYQGQSLGTHTVKGKGEMNIIEVSSIQKNQLPWFQ